MNPLFSKMLQWVDLSFLGQTTFSLLVTLVLCGAIGLEREHVHRPAGVRTHLLVGLSSCLVMLTSHFLLRKYDGQITIDITRLSAQILSGIGFLGAGTIIREGYSVKGLTTAASLWSVACIGIASGAGFYSGATILTIIILGALAYLKIRRKSPSIFFIKILLENVDETLVSVEKLLDEYHIFVHQIEITPFVKSSQRMVKIKISMPPELNGIRFILQQIETLEGVISTSIE